MRQRRKKQRGSLLRAMIGATLITLAILGGVGVGVVVTISQTVPQAEALREYRPHEATKIYSADGQLIASLYVENREVVEIEEIPAALIQATLAIEDARFYRHCGVDLRGIARALRQDLLHGRPAQGGSTITQQLARDVYLTRQKTLMRKLQEALLALRLERTYSKEEILSLYLNQMCYGHGAYGVAAAANVYFGKKVQDLTLPECALLAGLTRWPVGYSPFNNPDRARYRRAVVLNRMVELGYISEREAEEAKAAPLGTDPARLKRAGLRGFRAPYFATYVVQQLVDRYGEDAVYKGGLRVYTTLHIPLQIVADQALKQGVQRARPKGVSQGALVSIDPRNGHILALVGGVNFYDPENGQFNRATQALRQPGSAFKPFVYTAAIEAGFSPWDVFSATPTTFMNLGEPYPVQNYTPKQAGPYTLERALAQSVNVVAVRVCEKVGPRQVIDCAHRMGIQQPLHPYLSLALGSCEVTPLELAAAYIPFATGGFRVDPIAILRIEDSEGHVIYRARSTPRRVISERTAYVMKEMLRGVVLNGTGRSANIGLPQGGKTGTTSEDKDAWYVGFTPGLVTAVWMGNDQPKPMRTAWGGNTCAPVWVEVTKAAAKMFEWPEDFPRPSQPVRYQSRSYAVKPRAEGDQTVTICTESGLLATEHCPQTATRRFRRGSAPTESCSMHGPEDTGSERAETPTRSSPQGGPPGADSPPPTPTPQETPREPTSPTPGAAGLTVSAPPMPTEPKPEPDLRLRGEQTTVVICTESGQLATPSCPHTAVRKVSPGEAPTRKCPKHGEG